MKNFLSGKRTWLGVLALVGLAMMSQAETPASCSSPGDDCVCIPRSKLTNAQRGMLDRLVAFAQQKNAPGQNDGPHQYTRNAVQNPQNLVGRPFDNIGAPPAENGTVTPPANPSSHPPCVNGPPKLNAAGTYYIPSCDWDCAPRKIGCYQALNGNSGEVPADETFYLTKPMSQPPPYCELGSIYHAWPPGPFVDDPERCFYAGFTMLKHACTGGNNPPGTCGAGPVPPDVAVTGPSCQTTTCPENATCGYLPMGASAVWQVTKCTPGQVPGLPVYNFDCRCVGP